MEQPIPNKYVFIKFISPLLAEGSALFIYSHATLQCCFFDNLIFNYDHWYNINGGKRNNSYKCRHFVDKVQRRYACSIVTDYVYDILTRVRCCPLTITEFYLFGDYSEINQNLILTLDKQPRASKT